MAAPPNNSPDIAGPTRTAALVRVPSPNAQRRLDAPHGRAAPAFYSRRPILATRKVGRDRPLPFASRIDIVLLSRRRSAPALALAPDI
jgi:hypothetical protein